MSGNENSLDVLREILVWTKVGFFGTAKKTLEEVLNSEKKRVAYQMADGTRSLESIRLEVKMSPNDLTELFKVCCNVGLMKTLDGGKRQRLFDLSQFGLEVKLEDEKK